MVRGKEKLAQVAKDADLVIDHKESDKGRPAGSKGALPVIKTMVKTDLQREVGASRKKIRDLEKKLSELTKAGGPPEDQIPPELWAVFPVMAYDYMATRFGPHWKLNEEEMLLYGQNLQKVADKYLGAVVGDNPELFSLAIVVVSITVPKVMVTLRAKKPAPESEGKPDALSGKKSDRDHNGPRSKGVGEK